mmetsp:Transcript_9331/g.15057  ORF Transcript_9331/g.15057 Transcript_9331/m.15057 type:complete len:262 (+) Transcript_9331:564-1349(+)
MIFVFEYHIQIWIGCELGYEEPKLADENKMKLGFVRRTMCSLVLNAINMMRGAILHYSFGDEKQLPHISFPLYIAADTFVETSKNSSKKEEEAEGGGSTELEGCKTDDSKSGSPELEACKTDDSKKCEEPPPIGVAMFPEEEAGMKTRRKRNIKDIFSFKGGEEACYSFSLHNGNLDLFSWMVRGIPGVKPMDLTQYWRDLPLRIVAYMTEGDLVGSKAMHTHENKKYLFNFILSNKDARKRYHDLAGKSLPRSKSTVRLK